MASLVCIVCGRGDATVKCSDDEDNFNHFKQCLNDRVKYGELKYAKLAEQIEEVDDWKTVAYHKECRKLIVHSVNIERLRKRSFMLSDDNGLHTNPKKGRPGNYSDKRKNRVLEELHPQNCIFSHCAFCPKTIYDTHQVLTENKGSSLLEIKMNTYDDDIRVALSDLFEAGDAVAKKKRYHRHCCRTAERSTNCDINASKNRRLFDICDAEITLFVKEAISQPGNVMTMNEVNDAYVNMLSEHDMCTTNNINYKKQLKSLLLENVPNIQIVASAIKNHSDLISLKKVVSDKMDEYFAETSMSFSLETTSVSKLIRLLRQEVLEARGWKFEGDFGTWRDPPLLSMVLNHVIHGRVARDTTGKRCEIARSTVSMVTQAIVQNVKTDRQIRNSSDKAFHQSVETPLSVGLPLSIHSRFRDSTLLKNLTNIHLGNEYTYILNIEKRVECAVLKRMEKTGGYCLPDFVKKDVPIYFAVDNIDFLECTAYGQNTLHGTMLVLFQRDIDGVPVNESIRIPSSLPEASNKLKIHYHDAPELKLHPIRFKKYSFEDETQLQKYTNFTNVWAMTSFLGNESSYQNETNTNKANLIGNEEAVNLDKPTVVESVVEKHGCIELISKDKKSEKLEKETVMPTWAATQHLMMKQKESFTEPNKTNIETVAPILPRPPHDFGCLYTILCIAQDINAVVVGPNKKVIITLDMDLFTRAMQLKVSTFNDNLVLMPGHLHLFFAQLHALGKILDGSGLETIAIESSVYSPAAIRGIYSGKQYKRGIEYHIMNIMALLSLKFEAVFGKEVPQSFQKKAEALRVALHKEDIKMLDIYEDLAQCYLQDVDPKLCDHEKGLHTFMNNYILQVEVMLAGLSAIRSRDFEGSLAAISNAVKYFAATDLYNYFKMIPVHLGQMQELKESDPVTWQHLSEGDFVATKTPLPFCNLFTDQALEQEIKSLKRYGALPGLTQDDNSLHRFITIAPHLTRIVERFFTLFPLRQQKPDQKSYYQLEGNISLRCAENSIKIRNCLVAYCQGNLYNKLVPLKSIVSSALIPPEAITDILTYPQQGQDLYEKLVKERLENDSKSSIWDPISLSKIKRFSNWMTKRSVPVGDKVLKLREDRAMMARCMIVAKERPGLIPKMEDLIGNYEISLVPRANFAIDGSVLVSADKASLMTGIRNLQENTEITDAPFSCMNEPIKPRVLILDAMCLLNALKKGREITKMKHLKDQFIECIASREKNHSYVEIRVLFDSYSSKQGIKDKTHNVRRAVDRNSIGMSGDNAGGFDVHDEMNLQKVPLKSLLSCKNTKKSLTRYFALGILKHYECSTTRVLVSYEQWTRINKPFQETLNEDLKHHKHEEADTLIPLHITDCIRESAFKFIEVESIDTDVLVLLIDLVAWGRLGAMTSLILKAGKGNKRYYLDIRERVTALGESKARGLLGFHHFTGADYGGKFVGISKKKWTDNYLKLNDDSDLVKAFWLFGSFTSEQLSLIDEKELHDAVRPLEEFICLVYSKDGAKTLPVLRWDLFRTKNLESELLPPTRATLLPHVQRTNHVCKMGRSYITSQQDLPAFTESGWVLDERDNTLKPLLCLLPPAPKGVVELVKCGCKVGDTCGLRCTCKKAKLPCTSLCKCRHRGCSNASVTNDLTEDEDH